MRSMVTDRRRLLAGLAATAVSLRPFLAAAAAPQPRRFVGAVATGTGFAVATLSADGAWRVGPDLPGRGHTFAVAPSGRVAVAFARRPGTFAVPFEPATGDGLGLLQAAPGRHFYGHGTFSADGRRLYAAENDHAGERGVIGVYDVAAGWRRLGELASHGIGPHDVHLLSDGRTLAVANGGILTRPDLPRVKLNIPTMRPTLAYVDAASGRLLQAVELAADLHRLSIRHLARAADDTIVFAMQDEGPAGRPRPLFGRHRLGERAPVLVDEVYDGLRAMRGYCGSVMLSGDGRTCAVSSPHGNLVTLWRFPSLEPLGKVAIEDVCGLAPLGPDGFLASSGTGALVHVAADGTQTALATAGGVRWDNHLAVV